MFRVFAPEGESVRKYALIFRGISENWEGKTKNGYDLKVACIAFISSA